MKAQVHVTLKPSIFDPQGEAVKKAIEGLGVDQVESVRIGKSIEIDFSGACKKDAAEIRAKLEPICADLLSNPVIENYTLQIKEA